MAGLAAMLGCRRRVRQASMPGWDVTTTEAGKKAHLYADCKQLKQVHDPGRKRHWQTCQKCQERRDEDFECLVAERLSNAV